MELNQYQQLSERTSRYKDHRYDPAEVGERPPEREKLLRATLQLVAASGKLLERLKKHFFFGHPLDAEATKADQVRLHDAYWDMVVAGDKYQDTPPSSPAPSGRDRLLAAAFGLGGEVGELLEHLEQHLFAGAPFDAGQLTGEGGDVQYYVAEVFSALGIELEQVGQKNIDKLKKRYPEGFTEERSLNRLA